MVHGKESRESHEKWRKWKSTCYKRSFAYFLIKTIIQENTKRELKLVNFSLFSIVDKKEM